MIACFGELLLRLSTAPGTRLAQASNLAVHCGGAEANVAALLAQLGHEARMVSVLPRSSLGDLSEAELRRVGIDTQSIIRADGRMGLYLFEPVLGGHITYDREHSAFVAHGDEIDWAALAPGVRWFHLSGINLALGGKAPAAALAGARAMRSAGATVSFDVNHRASLWEGRGDEDVGQLREVAALTDVLFASGRDIARMLKLDPVENATAAVTQAFSAFRQLGVIASTRRSLDADGHRLSVRIDQREESHQTEEAPLGPVVDRIGSGDAFAGAVIDGLVRGASLEDCARQGLAAAVMKHGISGDRWIGTRQELDAFDPFAAGDIRR